MFYSQVLGIDAEFVSLAPAVKEPNPEVPGGPDIVVQAARLGLARVSVVRGGQTSGLGDSNDTASLVPVIDDYIRAVEPVHDYLTRFSGLVPGDLDPALSKHHIVELKHAYLKLRYLVDAGCVFVGHGLKQDFKMINVTVPPAQIVDTVELFHFKRQRKLSLRFLASYLLKEDIQQETHDSIEDARTAVRLYHKYLEMQAAGNFQGQLLEIYRFGKQHGFTGEKRPDNVDEFTKNSGDTAAVKTADSLAHASSSGVGVAAALRRGRRGRRRTRRRGAVPKLLHRRRRALRLGRRGDGTCPLVPTPHAGRVNPRPDPDAQPTPKHPNRDTGADTDVGADAPSGCDDDAGVERPAADAPGGSAAAAADADALRGSAAAAAAARGAAAEARAPPKPPPQQH